MIRVGTLCFLIPARMIVDPPTTRLPPGLSEGAGRVVEIIGALCYQAKVGRQMYQVDAPWLRQQVSLRCRFFAAPGCLIPISEPPDELPAPPQHEPLTA